MAKQYLLKNKDKIVLQFSIDYKTQVFESLVSRVAYIQNVELVNKDLLPYNLNYQNNLSSNLEQWINKRKVPKNREFVHKILSTLQIQDHNNFMAYIDISLGLSLNDTYWIIPLDSDYKWQDYNLYDNSFNETLALVAFTGYSTKIKGLITSPEFTTNGMLKKCWHRNIDTGKIELIKGQTEINGMIIGKEAYSEYYACQIAKILGLNSVHYELKKFHNQIVSCCDIFTNQEQGYIPIAYCLDEKINYNDNTELFPAIIKIYGRENWQDLLLFDAIICNTDRHLGNFGLLINNDNKQIIQPAPIFDNGSSIFNFIHNQDINHIDELVGERLSWFQLSFDEQAQFAVQKRHINALLKLENFQFKRHEKYNIEETLLKAIEQFIQKRSQKIIKMLENK
ncbi:MAG: hypothetical protein J6M05_05755 [Cardiobacteriaceae bacterium]|nr:hypothetical protein [Cardiobacteriaceae bacterium]